MCKWDKKWKDLKGDETVVSPNVSLEALSNALIFDAMEGRYTAIFGLTG